MPSDSPSTAPPPSGWLLRSWKRQHSTRRKIRMRTFKRILAAGLTILTCLQALPARADQGVVGTADLDRALRARADAETAARDTIKDLLARDEVRAVAGHAGLDLKRANAAVDTLQGAELQEMAGRAAAA